VNTDKFKTFLKSSGAEILEPTNPYEVVRFKTANGVSVVYKGKRGYSFTGDAQDAWDAMQKKNIWTVEPRGIKEKRKTLTALIDRDGHDCFYCGKETDDTNRTIEHLLAVAHGGNNNMNNLALACQDCNVAVGDMSILEKMHYREALRQRQG
jgi:5-methylcytosine-specific restriction endonuclease McrA